MTTSERQTTTLWFAGRSPSPTAHFRVFCFPYAGLGTSVFRRWTGALGDGVDFCPVQLPGRESRMREEPFRRMDVLIDAAEDALEPYLDVPFAIFGHSLGALIAFELARRFGAHPMLRRLFVSARRAPHLNDPSPDIAHLPDQEFIDEVQRRYGGIPAAVLQCQDLLDLLLRHLRADFELLETFEFCGGSPLPCPISIFGGRRDTTIAEPELRAWQVHTAAGVRLRMFDDGHLYLQEQRDALIEGIRHDLGIASPVTTGVAV